jgi:hypothetical protein
MDTSKYGSWPEVAMHKQHLRGNHTEVHLDAGSYFRTAQQVNTVLDAFQHPNVRHVRLGFVTRKKRHKKGIKSLFSFSFPLRHIPTKSTRIGTCATRHSVVCLTNWTTAPQSTTISTMHT